LTELSALSVKAGQPQPGAPGDISYLLWLVMGYLLVWAVLVLAWSRQPVRWAPVMIEVSGDDGGVR